jgi:hypothetical protein
MKKEDAITVFVDTYPGWKSMRKRFAVRRDGANDIILLEGLPVGRVWEGKQNGRPAIFAELLVGPPQGWC